jgi:putative hydrolase of the HAD superfamily
MFLNGIDAIVFDAVGTLIYPDPPAATVYHQIGARFGSKVPTAMISARFRQALDLEDERDRALGLRTSEARERERWQNIVARVLPDVSDPDACFLELFSHFSRPCAWRCDSDAAATLERLASQGYGLGLASNYDSRLASVVVGLADLRWLLDHVVISSEVGWRKPAVQFFTAVTQRMKCPRDRILFVGDDLVNDFQGAQAAGLRAVLFDPRRTAPTDVVRLTRLGDLGFGSM